MTNRGIHSRRALFAGALILAAASGVAIAAPPSTSRGTASKPTAARPATLRERLDQILLDGKPPKARFSGNVVELPSGRVIYDSNPDLPLMPASNMKLVVMAAALDTLGRDHRFETILALRGKDLVVIGGGDPTIGDEHLCRGRGEAITALFHRWAGRLKAAGVREIAGDLVVDDSLFDQRFVHRNWPADQFEAWYEAPVGALSFNSNCVDVQLSPGKPGLPAPAQIVPGNAWIQIENKSTTGPRHTVTAHRSREVDAITLRGAVARSDRIGPISVRDPGMYFGHVLKTVLAAEGIGLRGQVVRRRIRDAQGRTPADCRIIDTYASPLRDALARCGKDSLGMMAESLLKFLGARQAQVGSWETGRAVVEQFLTKAGASIGQFCVDDGSGLSRDNRLSASAVTSVLRYIYASGPTLFDALRDALSHAGADGTLKKRMKVGATRGRVFAKTGYINGVRTLAGYIQTQDGRWLAFAFFYNGSAKTRQFSQMQDEACAALASWKGP